GLTASPYTVSVGSNTTPPLPKHSTIWLTSLIENIRLIVQCFNLTRRTLSTDQCLMSQPQQHACVGILDTRINNSRLFQQRRELMSNPSRHSDFTKLAVNHCERLMQRPESHDLNTTITDQADVCIVVLRGNCTNHRQFRGVSRLRSNDLEPVERIDIHFQTEREGIHKRYPRAHKR